VASGRELWKLMMPSSTGSVKMIHRSWIDVFEDCGTVFRSILNYLDEFDLYQIERMHRYDANGEIRLVVNSSFSYQWVYLDQLDRSRGANERWRRPQETEKNVDNRNTVEAARFRGIEYVRNALFARNRAKEAWDYFDFNRDIVSANDVPVRSIKSMTEKAGDWIRPISKQRDVPIQYLLMPLDYWQKWTCLDGEGVAMDDRTLDVFLELCFHKGGGSSSETRYWRGFRKAHYYWRNNSIRIRLDLDSLVQDMGWTELKDIRDQSRDYRQSHCDGSISQRRMKSLMKKIQVTVLDVADFSSIATPSDQDRRLLIATGGYASPAHSRRDYTIIFAANANVARFHCRNDRSPLEQLRNRQKPPSGPKAWSYTRPTQPPSNPFRSTFLKIPTPNNTDQSLEIIIKVQW